MASLSSVSTSRDSSSFPAGSSKEHLDMLEEYKKDLEKELRDVEKEIEETKKSL